MRKAKALEIFKRHLLDPTDLIPFIKAFYDRLFGGLSSSIPGLFRKGQSIQMGELPKRNIYERFLKSARAADIEFPEECMLCPLCWTMKPLSDMSLEHIVPGSVGGKSVTLTCKACNNSHGHLYDSHLAGYQTTTDQLSGHGVLRSKLCIQGSEATANVAWGNGYTNIEILEEFSNPKHVEGMRKNAESCHIDEIAIHMKFGFAADRFKIGLLRCAYLALFKCFGYEYAKTSSAQVVRQRICNPSDDRFRLDSLIGKICSNERLYDEPYLVACGQISEHPICLVIIRLAKETSSHHLVFLPMGDDRNEGFFDAMEELSRVGDKQNLVIPKNLLFT